MSIAQAIIQGGEDMLRQYLTMAPELNTYDEYGFTPLVECGVVNRWDFAKLVVQAGAHIDYRDITGGSVLHWAVENNNIEFVQWLLKQGADPNGFTSASEPVLVKPMLRKQAELKSLLVSYGADETFARDFINTKLLGHRFELVGQVDILTPAGEFAQVDLEGFFLEFSLDVIQQSLVDFKHNFMARHWQEQSVRIQVMIDALARASQLIRFQHYQLNAENYREQIDALLSYPLKIIPIAYEGHAITLVAFNHMIAICDRRNTSQFADHVRVYRMRKPHEFSLRYIKSLIYTKQTTEHIEQDIKRKLGLEHCSSLLIERQIAGNCSWANVEAAVPAALLLVSHDFDTAPPELIGDEHGVMMFYREWVGWEKERALHFCLTELKGVSPKRKASILALLAALLFQRCDAKKRDDLDRARRIIRALNEPDYAYLLESYLKIYPESKPAGKNLRKLLAAAEDPFV